MSLFRKNRSLVAATAYEVLPKFGLAFLVDDQQTTWAITLNMQVPGLDSLRAGQRFQMVLDNHAEFTVVSAYEPLD